MPEKTASKMDHWEPVRQGDNYCAPFCGRGCTWQEYQTALKESAQMAEELEAVPTDIKYGEWKIQVWENLGWHWCLTKGSVVLHKHGDEFYSAFLNKAGPWGGNAVEEGKTAEEAIKKLLHTVREQLKPMAELCERLGVTCD